MLPSPTSRFGPSRAIRAVEGVDLDARTRSFQTCRLTPFGLLLVCALCEQLASGTAIRALYSMQLRCLPSKGILCGYARTFSSYSNPPATDRGKASVSKAVQAKTLARPVCQQQSRLQKQEAIAWPALDLPRLHAQVFATVTCASLAALPQNMYFITCLHCSLRQSDSGSTSIPSHQPFRRVDTAAA